MIHFAGNFGRVDSEEDDDDGSEDRATLFGMGPGSDPPPPPSVQEAPEAETEEMVSRQLFLILDAYGKKRREVIKKKTAELGVSTLSEPQMAEVDAALEDDLWDIAADVADLAYNNGKTFSDLEHNEHIRQFHSVGVFGDTDFLSLVAFELDSLNESFSRELSKPLAAYAKKRQAALAAQKVQLGVAQLPEEQMKKVDASLSADFWKTVDAVVQLARKNKKGVTELSKDKHIQQFDKDRIFGDMDFLTLISFELDDVKKKEKAKDPHEISGIRDISKKAMVRVAKTLGGQSASSGSL